MQSPLFRRQFMAGMAPLAALSGASAAQRTARGPICDIREYGATPDASRLNTKSIQAAIDECAKAGGGTVLFPPGAYLSGTIVLKSRVTLDLQAGATLLGSKNLDDYPPHIPAFRSYTDTYTEKSLIFAEGVEDIAICGRGIIDGQGASFKGPYKVRPYMMRFVQCRNISVADVTIKDSPMWVQHYLACDEVDIHGISVHSRVNANNDGIDIDCCQRVRISNCEITSGDDAIVLKSTADRPCKDVVITNCVLSTRCNALKLGTESNGGFDNIAISNCTIYDTRLAGIAVEAVDGAVLDRVSISNIAMNGVGTPIFIRLGDRARPFVAGGPRPRTGTLRNVSIANVQAAGAGKIGCAIAGLPQNAIENVTLENIRLAFAGGGKASDARREVPEKPDAYPEHSMFGVLPAYAFYCRHVKNISLRGIQTSLDQTDERPALVCDDVDTLEVVNSTFAGASEAEPSISLNQVKGAFLHGSRATGARTWLRLSGAQTRDISVIGNHLANAHKAIQTSSEVANDAVFTASNRVS